MYEHITYEDLVARMLRQALETNGNLDSREGSLLWLGAAPAAVELQNLYIALDTVLNETFADTAHRPYLILRAAERGLAPMPATPAVLQLTCAPASLELEMGARFSIGELNYFVSEKLGPGSYAITCETPGEAGGRYEGRVIPIEYIKGLQSCDVTALLVPGENEEDTELFRRRYFDSLDALAFGGNRADYLRKVNAIPGVGGVKVYRAWNGDIPPTQLCPPQEAAQWIAAQQEAPSLVKQWLTRVYEAGSTGRLTVGGTVRLTIITSAFAAPSQALVDQVQTAVDPLQNAGEGMGLAPIGHVVRVGGVRETPVSLAFSLLHTQNRSWEQTAPQIRKALEGYFKELAKGWADQQGGLVIRVSRIESRLLELPGILDVAETQINGQSSNLVLGEDEIPVLGELTARELAPERGRA